MKPRIYHNPRCSKSRATMALLEAEGLDVEVVEYLKTPPDADHLQRLLEKLGVSAAEFIRRGEPEFEEAGVDADASAERELIELMVAHPKLIQRPIVEIDDAARIGRPPEKVLELFS